VQPVVQVVELATKVNATGLPRGSLRLLLQHGTREKLNRGSFMSEFYDFTIDTVLGEMTRCERYTEQLDRDAIERLSRVLDKASVFREIVADADVNLLWTQERATSALATFYSGDRPLIRNALASGYDPAEDKRVLEVLQALIAGVQSVPHSGFLSIVERPVIVSAQLPVAAEQRGALEAANALRPCLAAAFFQRNIRSL